MEAGKGHGREREGKGVRKEELREEEEREGGEDEKIVTYCGALSAALSYIHCNLCS